MEQEQSIFRSRIYYFAMEISGVTIPLVVAILIVLFPPYFAWYGENILKAEYSLFAIGGTNLTLLLINNIFRKNFIFSLTRYLYVVFIAYMICITGWVNSSLNFIILFPVISTAVYLKRITTRNLSIVAMLFFASTIFFMPPLLVNPSIIVKHIVQIVLFAIILYIIYSMVIETIAQRSGREESTKRLSEMAQIDRLKSDFLSVAQHQLRTPLSGVKWSLEMLREEPAIPLESKSMIEASLERVKDSIEIINQMLKTVESEGENLSLKPEDVDIVGAIQSITTELNFIVYKKHAKIAIMAPPSLMMKIDRSKMRAALINIIDNAIKYSPRGLIDIEVTEAENKVKIVVRDTGIGISPSDMPYVFDRLHRGKNAVMLEPDESGVGLYIAKKIIELHGGTISISSELMKGTIVTIVLPKN